MEKGEFEPTDEVIPDILAFWLVLLDWLSEVGLI